jgi:hypothetical protein
MLVVGACGVFLIVKACHCPCMPSPPSSSFFYGFGCCYHGLLIVIARKYPPSPFWFWWSCGLGRHYGLFVAIVSNWPPSPLWFSWSCGLGHHFSFFYCCNHQLIAIVFLVLWFCGHVWCHGTQQGRYSKPILTYLITQNRLDLKIKEN